MRNTYLSPAYILLCQGSAIVTAQWTDGDGEGLLFLVCKVSTKIAETN